MAIELLSRLPDYAKDIKLNLSSLLARTEPVNLTQLQIAGLALAAAYATRQSTVIHGLEQFAREQGLTGTGMNAVKAAAALMAMNNVYYRSVHWIQGDTYIKLPANLRMHMLKSHGVTQQDLELYCVVVSAINGCAYCLDSHVKVLEKGHMDTAAIHYSLRLAAVIQALAQVITIEEASGS
jgi:lipoyl-dependent peroxiredoxin subunit D